ncbi:MAG: ABC transporter ATP-binding protein [Christensenella sp.]|nr:ABC transporter ATP-binding protein [Christensenella sp.]
MNMIEAENVSKIYNIYKKPSDRLKEAMSFIKKKSYGEKFYALDSVSFQVEKGETFGIVGVNGAGKSTILKIITGITNASAGTVAVNGRVSALLELGAGFNMQYTGRQNIYLNGVMRGIPKEEMDERIQDIIKFADIGDFLDNPVRMYSSGMFARLAFAVAINVDPEILIVDEALAVGDAAFQAKCFRKFEQLCEKGVTILFVSHDISSVKRMCNRAMWLENGKVREIGEAAKVCNRFSSYMMERKNQEIIADIDKEEQDSQQDSDFIKKEEILLSKYSPIPEDCDRAGTGEAKIRSLFITNKDGQNVSQLAAYHTYDFHIVAEFMRPQKEVLIGLVFENTRALSVFYLNNYNEDNTLDVKEAGIYEMTFKVTLPGLQKNSYLISPAVATGTQLENVMLDWCHNVMTVQVENPGFNLSVLDLNPEDIMFRKL